MEYAVIRTGGKQHRVKVGDVIEVEKLKGKEGDKVVFKEVLALSDGSGIKFGEPLLKGSQVEGTIVQQKKGKKLLTFKKLKRKDSKVKRGHRQELTVVRIDKIKVSRTK